ITPMHCREVSIMPVHFRRAFPALVLASTLLASSALSPAAAAAAPAVWAQDKTDVKPDPALRFGVLPNGMRYVLMKNATPPGQVSLRLRFDVGSFMETDKEAGLAHF